MTEYLNVHNLNEFIIISRIRDLDLDAKIFTRSYVDDLEQTIHVVSVISSLPTSTITSTLSTPATANEIAFVNDYLSDRQAVKSEYLNMVARLDQIQNAGAIPFTQAGFNQLVQAVKDVALYEERIMRVIKVLHF